jgi:hypothetical protein
MLPIVFIIVLAILIYKSAREYGRNAVLWTVAAVVGYLVIQFAFGVVIGIVLVIGAQVWGWSPTLIDDYSLLIGLVALAPAIGYVLILWKIVTRVPENYVPTVKKSPMSIYDGE